MFCTCIRSGANSGATCLVHMLDPAYNMPVLLDALKATAAPTHSCLQMEGHKPCQSQSPCKACRFVVDDTSDGRTAGVSSADERPGSRWLPGSVGSAIARRFCRLPPCRTGSVRSSAARVDALPLQEVYDTAVRTCALSQQGM